MFANREYRFRDRLWASKKKIEDSDLPLEVERGTQSFPKGLLSKETVVLLKHENLDLSTDLIR